MPRKRTRRPGPLRSQRRKIQASGILDALIEYVEGRREMTPDQVSAALGLLKKAETLSDKIGRSGNENPAPQKDRIEIRIVDPRR